MDKDLDETITSGQTLEDRLIWRDLNLIWEGYLRVVSAKRARKLRKNGVRVWRCWTGDLVWEPKNG